MTHCKHGLVAGILFLAVALTPVMAASGPFEDGLDANDSGDYAAALRLWRPLAEQGHADAQTGLGAMYGMGLGVPQNHAEAVKWYQLAAEQGHARAQHNLGVTYATGQGAPQDYVQAHMWFSLAGSRFPPDEDRDAVQSRDWVAAQMTPAQIAEAQKLAREWRPQTPSGFAHGVDAPGPTAGKGNVQKYETVQDRRVAAVQDGEEALRRVGDEIGERHDAGQQERDRAGE